MPADFDAKHLRQLTGEDVEGRSRREARSQRIREKHGEETKAKGAHSELQTERKASASEDAALRRVMDEFSDFRERGGISCDIKKAEGFFRSCVR